jgi:hypothetical protein
MQRRHKPPLIPDMMAIHGIDTPVLAAWRPKLRSRFGSSTRPPQHAETIWIGMLQEAAPVKDPSGITGVLVLGKRLETPPKP